MKFTFKKSPPKEKNLLKAVLQEGEVTELYQKGEQKELRLGYGKSDELSLRKVRLLLRRLVFEAKGNKCKKVSVSFDSLATISVGLSEHEFGEILAREALLANYEFQTYKSEPKGGFAEVKEMMIVTGKATVSKEFKEGLKRGQVIGEEVNRARELANTPGGEMTPELLAKAAKSAAREAGQITVTVFDEKRLLKEGMQAILGVGKGSDAPPRLITLNYNGGKKGERPIVLAGKGITYDSGGLNLKPTKGGSMNEMHMDMSGGAAVVATLAAISRLGIKRNVVGLIPAAENMVDGSSYRPGDVIRSYSGKTIEVGNTDAEGRVVLADALAYAAQFNPELVVDVATLTGGAVVALGFEASAIFTEDTDLMVQTVELGEITGDYVWPMPLWDEFKAEVSSKIADVRNAGKNSPYGSSSVGAIFLKQFADGYAKDCPWMHIDMAPTMTSKADEYLAFGAKGVPVHLLIKLIEEY